MSYVTIRGMLCVAKFQDKVLIESLFKETTRSGRFVLRLVQLALTPNLIIMVPMNALNCSNKKPYLNDDKILKLLSFYPLENLKMNIFKKTNRQSFKISFHNNLPTKYFELNTNNKRKMYWQLWSLYVLELSSERKTWPFTNSGINNVQNEEKRLTNIIKQNNVQHLQWIDKYLYLGLIREHEDNYRPIPIPGLGPTEDIKLLYLKPQYFGCWDQSEHWVQCD